MSAISECIEFMYALFVLIPHWVSTWDWGNVADWFGAIGTIGAVVLALYTRKKRGITNVKVYCEIKRHPVLLDDPSGRPGKVEYFKKITQFRVILSNIGNASILVTGINVDIDSNLNINLALGRPEIVESGDVRVIEYVGFGLLSTEINSKNNNKEFGPEIFEYVKSHKKEIELTTHDGITTKWPIEIKGEAQ